jgi:endo-1,4-beta-xylanase
MFFLLFNIVRKQRPLFFIIFRKITDIIMKKVIPLLIFTVFFISCNQKPGQQETGLKEFSSYPVGTAMGLDKLNNDTNYYCIVLHDFNSITVESRMKMKHVLKSPDSLYFGRVDSIMDFCRNNNIRLHGHTLLWHESTPAFVEEITDSASLEDFMKQYIHEYVGRYKGKVASWDVVNEGISDSAGLLRETSWLRTLGPGYIERAFQYTHEADPDARLFYNEYLIETNGVKMDATLNLIDELQEKGIPIHGLGFQMHTIIDTPDIDTFKNALQRAVDRGLLIHISELDVRVNRYHEKERFTQYSDSVMKIQGNRYYEVVKAYNEIVPPEQQYGITLWGFSDKYSWIPRHFSTIDWPCIYDSSYMKKPGWENMRQALSE